jgi:hypothetical protein
MATTQTKTAYQPKKLLKLPKEMPSNIVSALQVLTKYYQIIKADVIESKEPQTLKALGDPKVKIEIKKIPAFKGT